MNDWTIFFDLPQENGLYLACVKNSSGISWKIREFFWQHWMLDGYEDREDAIVICWTNLPPLPIIENNQALRPDLF